MEEFSRAVGVVLFSGVIMAVLLLGLYLMIEASAVYRFGAM